MDPSSAAAALFWGALSSASLYLGQLLAKPLGRSERATGLMMGFGAGTLLSAVAYELIPRARLEETWATAVAFLAGAVVYYAADQVLDRRGGGSRQSIQQGMGAEGSGSAMFLGALLDGVPEAFILGLTLALGGSISVAFLAAVFVSNIPQGLAGTTSLQEAGTSDRRIFWMWTGLTAVCGLASLLGFLTADRLTHASAIAEGFAGGAVLVMLADSMMPEAFHHGGRAVGLLTVVGFLVAGILTVVQ
ncbi:MAG: ZIP family zinc transporter [Nocardioidaceae bacterium]|nr:ZIP family zinc transporter [Nocardioidaceae bacterium]